MVVIRLSVSCDGVAIVLTPTGCMLIVWRPLGELCIYDGLACYISAIWSTVRNWGWSVRRLCSLVVRLCVVVVRSYVLLCDGVVYVCEVFSRRVVWCVLVMLTVLCGVCCGLMVKCSIVVVECCCVCLVLCSWVIGLCLDWLQSLNAVKRVLWCGSWLVVSCWSCVLLWFVCESRMYHVWIICV